MRLERAVRAFVRAAKAGRPERARTIMEAALNFHSTEEQQHDPVVAVTNVILAPRAR